MQGEWIFKIHRARSPSADSLNKLVPKVKQAIGGFRFLHER